MGNGSAKVREWEYRRLDLSDTPRRGDDVHLLNSVGHRDPMPLPVVQPAHSHGYRWLLPRLQRKECERIIMGGSRS